jgi:hypothetical protein
MLSPFLSRCGEDPCTVEPCMLSSAKRAALSQPRVHRGQAGVVVHGTVDSTHEFSFTEINPIYK